MSIIGAGIWLIYLWIDTFITYNFSQYKSQQAIRFIRIFISWAT